MDLRNLIIYQRRRFAIRSFDLSPSSERCHEAPDAKGGGAIAAQFAEICSEAHARRMDAKLGWQLGKNMRRLAGDAKAERRFAAARKTVSGSVD